MNNNIPGTEIGNIMKPERATELIKDLPEKRRIFFTEYEKNPDIRVTISYRKRNKIKKYHVEIHEDVYDGRGHHRQSFSYSESELFEWLVKNF